MKFRLLIIIIAAAFFSIDFSRARQHGSAGSADANGIFELHSAFWINLHHFLYLQAVLATPGAWRERAVAAQPPLPVRQMTPEQQTAWERALAYYRQFGSSDALRDRTLITANYQNCQTRVTVVRFAGRHLPPQMVTVLEDAAPVYSGALVEPARSTKSPMDRSCIAACR